MYLETILRLSKESPYVRSLDVAEAMSFSKPSVSRAMKILKENHYLSIDSNGHIKLLKKGRELANKIYERHIVITKALIALGVNKKQAEEDACKIEHCISDESFTALKKHIEKEEQTL